MFTNSQVGEPLEAATKFESAIESFTPNRSNIGIEEIIIEMARQEGEGKGSLETNNFFVENLLCSTYFDNEKIASLASVSVSFVEGIRKKLSS